MPPHQKVRLKPCPHHHFLCYNDTDDKTIVTKSHFSVKFNPEGAAKVKKQSADSQQFQIKPTNLEMFSWQLLSTHPSVAPIIAKYFGKIGLEYFSEPTDRDFIGDDNTGDFETEINQIPFEHLCNRDPIDACCDPTLSLDDIHRYLFNRPYFLLFGDGIQLEFVAALLYLINIRLQCSWGNPFFPESDSPCSTPIDWQDAMIYLRYYNLRVFNLSEDEILMGELSLAHYRATYVVDKLGLEQVSHLLRDFLNLDSLDRLNQNYDQVYNIFSEALGEDITELFLTQKKPRKINVDQLDFTELFRYPEWIEFDANAEAEIIRRILSGEISDQDADYFLGSLETHHNYVQLYPAIQQIINTTDNAHLLWVAGDILNLIWQTLPNDDRLQAWFRKEIYKMYWGRLGSIWPITHFNEITFNDLNQQAMVEDAMGWLVSLDDINKLNPELNHYLHQMSRRSESYLVSNVPEPVWQRAYRMRCQRCNDKQKFKLAFEQLDGDKAWRLLEHPNTIKQAEMYFDRALTDPTVTDEEALTALIRAMIHTHPDRVDIYVVEYFVHAFDSLVERFRDPAAVLDIFTATCSGVNTPAELEPLQAFADKCKTLLIADDLSIDIPKIVDAALAFAKDSVKDSQREQQELLTYFAEFVPEEERRPGRPRKVDSLLKTAKAKTAQAAEATESPDTTEATSEDSPSDTSDSESDTSKSDTSSADDSEPEAKPAKKSRTAKSKKS